MYVVGMVQGTRLTSPLGEPPVIADRREAFTLAETWATLPAWAEVQVYSLTETNGPVGRQAPRYTVDQLRRVSVEALDDFHLAWREYFVAHPDTLSSYRYTTGLWPQDSR